MAGIGRRARNIVGQVFGRLTVIERAANTARQKATWRCKCECGNEAVVIGTHLTTGETKSCGCMRREAQWNVTHGHASGKSVTRAYRTWLNMKYRCNVKSGRVWAGYGARGITYDPRWESFEEFLRDMGEPAEKLSLDRIDNDGNYCKANCRWASAKTQRHNNRANLTWVEIGGERMVLAEAVRRHGRVGYLATLLRIGNGWDPAAAVLAPPYSRRPS